MQQSWFTKTKEGFNNCYERVKPGLSVIGMFSIGFYIFYYFVFTYWIPQKYDSIILRLMMILLAFGWAFHRRLETKIKDYYCVYLIVSVFFCGPYYFSYMLLKNDISFMWSMIYIVQLCLVYYLLYNYFLLVLLSFLGFWLAYFVIILSGDPVMLSKFDGEHWIAVTFALVAGYFLSYKTELGLKERITLIKALSGSISHEMRNPLSSISMNSRSLSEYLKHSSPLNEGEAWSLSKEDLSFFESTINSIYRAADRGNKIASLILNNIKHEKIPTTDFEKLSMDTIVKETIEDYPFRSNKEKTSISCICKDNFEFYGDKVLMTYVLYNLMKNALYYFRNKPDGLFEIGMSLGEKVNTLWVQDNGPGIEKKRISNLFDNFSSFGKEGGTGLGLSFCKRAMEAFGGDIVCKSKLGEGTRFEMTFPIIKN